MENSKGVGAVINTLSKKGVTSGIPLHKESIKFWTILGAMLTPNCNRFTLKVSQCKTIVCASAVALVSLCQVQLSNNFGPRQRGEDMADNRGRVGRCGLAAPS